MRRTPAASGSDAGGVRAIPAAVCPPQVYDYRQKSSRVVWGPGLVMLAPDEQFTILSLSGGKPKQQNQVRLAR